MSPCHWEEVSLRVENRDSERSLPGSGRRNIFFTLDLAMLGSFSVMQLPEAFLLVEGGFPCPWEITCERAWECAKERASGWVLTHVCLNYALCHVSFHHQYSLSCIGSGRDPHPHLRQDDAGKCWTLSLEVRWWCQQRTTGLSGCRSTA